MTRTAQKSIASLMAGLLVIISALSGLFGGGASAQVLFGSGVAGVSAVGAERAHDHHAHDHHGADAKLSENGGHVPVGLGLGSSAPSPLPGCVATCLKSIASKLVPAALSIAHPEFDVRVVADWIQYGGHVFVISGLKRAGYWPNGPPGFETVSATGLERIVQMNARLRI